MKKLKLASEPLITPTPASNQPQLMSILAELMNKKFLLIIKKST